MKIGEWLRYCSLQSVVFTAFDIAQSAIALIADYSASAQLWKSSIKSYVNKNGSAMKPVPSRIFL